MLTFAQFLESLYRSDDVQIPDFNKKLKTYAHSPDWTTSADVDHYYNTAKKYGVPSSEADAEMDREGMTQRSTGLFAGDVRSASMYSAGGRAIPFVQSVDKKTKASTLTFQRHHQRDVESHPAWVSELPEEGFQKHQAGEYFSKKPGKPISQTHYDHGIDFTKKYHAINYTDDDLAEHAKREMKGGKWVFTQGVSF